MPNKPPLPIQDDSIAWLGLAVFLTFFIPAMLLYTVWQGPLRWFLGNDIEPFIVLVSIPFGIIYAIGFITSLRYFREILKGIISPGRFALTWLIGYAIICTPPGLPIIYSAYRSEPIIRFLDSSSVLFIAIVLGLIGPFSVIARARIWIWWVGDEELDRRQAALDAARAAQQGFGRPETSSQPQSTVEIDPDRFAAAKPDPAPKAQPSEEIDEDYADEQTNPWVRRAKGELPEATPKNRTDGGIDLETVMEAADKWTANVSDEMAEERARWHEEKADAATDPTQAAAHRMASKLLKKQAQGHKSGSTRKIAPPET